MRLSVALAFTVSPQAMHAQDAMAIWKDWGSYQFLGVLESNRLLVVQDQVYFVCDLEEEDNFFAVRNCVPALTDAQSRMLVAAMEREKLEAAERLRKQQAEAEKLATEAAAKAEALGALNDVSDETFANALVEVMRENKCVLELESSNVRNSSDLRSIVNELGIELSFDPAIVEELKTRSLSAIGDLYRSDQLIFGENSTSVILKDCN